MSFKNFNHLKKQDGQNTFFNKQKNKKETI